MSSSSHLAEASLSNEEAGLQAELKPRVVHTQGATAPLRWCWVEGGVGGPAYPPQVLVHPSPAIITTVETIGQIATGETVWAVRSAYSHG